MNSEASVDRDGLSSRRYRLARLIGAMSAAGLGIMALAGWGSGSATLMALHANFIPMAPNSALAFLVLGLSLGLLPRPGGTAKVGWVSVPGPLLVVMIVTLRLSEYATGIDLGVDHVMMNVHGESFGLTPVGKMALPTAIGFLIAGLSLLLQTRKPNHGWRDDLIGAMALFVALGGLVFTLGYLHNAPLMSGGESIPMALNTALGFGLLGLGMVAAAGPTAFPLRLLAGPSTRSRLLRVFLPFVAAIVMLVAWSTLLVSGYAGRSFAALMSASSIVLALIVAGLICARIAERVGGQLERAETALKKANEDLEAKVIERTRELSTAKALLEERNTQLEETAADLKRTSASVRRAHEELQETHEVLKRAESELVESEKLSSLRQMVAGMAHEINNPLAFVTSNVAVLQRDVGNLHEMIRFYREAEKTLAEHHSELLDRIHTLSDKIDLPFILENTDSLMSRSREGLKRIQQIVRDLREFARLDEAELKEADLNCGIKTTVSILRAKAEKQRVTLETSFAPLPLLTCYSAKINQLVLSLVDNAIDACCPGGHVTVSTRSTSHGIEIEVADNGRGIDSSIRGKIFDPFFTTKPIGKGTGLGLSMAYGIVQTHGGRIDVDSQPGHGSRFLVSLPVGGALS